MPDWLVSVLIQYPIVVVVGFVGWYCYRQVRAANEARVAELLATHARTVTTLAQAHTAHLGDLKELNGRLADELGGEVRKLGHKVDALTRKLN